MSYKRLKIYVYYIASVPTYRLGPIAYNRAFGALMGIPSHVFIQLCLWHFQMSLLTLQKVYKPKKFLVVDSNSGY